MITKAVLFHKLPLIINPLIDNAPFPFLYDQIRKPHNNPFNLPVRSKRLCFVRLQV